MRMPQNAANFGIGTLGRERKTAMPGYDGISWGSTRGPSDQILPADDFAEPRIVGDELLDEFMNAVLEDVIHMAVLEAVADASGVALRRSLAPIGDANLVEIPHQVFITACERSRQRIVGNQESCDQPRLQGFAVNPVIGGQCRDRAKNGAPLIEVKRPADMLLFGQQHVILDVEDARGVVGAFEM